LVPLARGETPVIQDRRHETSEEHFQVGGKIKNKFFAQTIDRVQFLGLIALDTCRIEEQFSQSALWKNRLCK
jgi:hypothetical protein